MDIIVKGLSPSHSNRLIFICTEEEKKMANYFVHRIEKPIPPWI